MANEMRLVDANALLKKAYYEDEELVVDVEDIENAPTIEAEPVVHAYWEPYNEGSDDYKRGWRCSHCKGYRFHNGGMIKKYKRCPNCGAHMDLKEADHGETD